MQSSRTKRRTVEIEQSMNIGSNKSCDNSVKSKERSDEILVEFYRKEGVIAEGQD